MDSDSSSGTNRPPRPNSAHRRGGIQPFAAPHAPPRAINVRGARSSASESEDSDATSRLSAREILQNELRAHRASISTSSSLNSSAANLDGRRSRSNSGSSSRASSVQPSSSKPPKLRRPSVPRSESTSGSQSLSEQSSRHSRRDSADSGSESRTPRASSIHRGRETSIRPSALEASIESLRTSTTTEASTKKSVSSSSFSTASDHSRTHSERSQPPARPTSRVPEKCVRSRAGSSMSKVNSDSSGGKGGSSSESLPLSESSAGSQSTSNESTSSGTAQSDSNKSSEQSFVTTTSSTSLSSSDSSRSTRTSSSSLTATRRDRSRSTARDRHQSSQAPPKITITTPLDLGLKKVRPGHKSKHHGHNSELPPLPTSPVPKHPDHEDSRASTPADTTSTHSKSTKLKIISPTTGAAVIVAETDLLKPAQSRSRAPSVASRHSDAGETPIHHEPTELSEKEEEEDRIRALLTSSAAVSSKKSKNKDRMDATDTGNAMAGTLFARAAENNVGPVIESGDPDIVFVDDGGKFRHLRKLKAGDERDPDEDSQSFDEQLHRLCVGIDTTCSYILQTGHGLYAGICLLSICLFPTWIPLITPQTNTYVFVEAFVAFYSPVAMPVSRVFNVLGTASVLAALDGGIDGAGEGIHRMNRWWKNLRGMVSGVGAVRWWRRRSGRTKRLAGFLAVFCAAISYICTIVMLYVDDRLYESQVGAFGGIYGNGNWYLNETTTTSINGSASTETVLTRYNPSAINATFNEFYPLASEDIVIWQNLNCTRGVFGVSGWFFCCLARMMVARRKGKHSAPSDGAVKHKTNRTRNWKVVDLSK